MLLEEITGTRLQVDAISTTAGFAALRPEWAELWAQSPTATPFQSPEWLLSWWRLFGGTGLLALAVRAEGRLVGLAPFFLHEHGLPSVRSLELLGTGITDHPDILIETGFEAPVVSAVFQYLAANLESWDECDFQQLRADSPLLMLPSPSNWRDEVVPQDACPTLALPTRGYDDDEAWLPASFLQNLRYERERLERNWMYEIETAHPENFSELFDALLRLQDARWASHELPGAISDEAVREFQSDAARGLLARGVLRLYALRLNGAIVAVYYGFLHQRRAYYYLGGADPEFERFSVGNQIVYHAIHEAIREGAESLDFLRGQNPFKYRWGAQDQPAYRRRLRALKAETLQPAGRFYP